MCGYGLLIVLFGIYFQKTLRRVYMRKFVITYIWLFPRIVVPQNGWFRMEIPINMDDLGVALFLETPIYIIIYIYMSISDISL